MFDMNNKVKFPSLDKKKGDKLQNAFMKIDMTFYQR